MANVGKPPNLSAEDFLEDAFWRGYDHYRRGWSRFVATAHRRFGLSSQALEAEYAAGVVGRAEVEALSG